MSEQGDALTTLPATVARLRIWWLASSWAHSQSTGILLPRAGRSQEVVDGDRRPHDQAVGGAVGQSVGSGTFFTSMTKRGLHEAVADVR